ncbi:MAG: tetratricopeptide repeat protein [SAR324 cluster bacterium]|nr:tetratricopeptide repeat protein [SAR324 cluster bacterium]
MSSKQSISENNQSMLDFRFPGLFLILSILTFLVYYPALQAQFIIDDEAFYIKDPLMTASDGLFRIWFSPLEEDSIWFYVPISRTTFWLERNLWGLDLRVTHGINIVLHWIASLMLWLFLRNLKIKGAWLIGVMFAIHPVHVQSVAWIAERRNVVAICFFIPCIWAYLRFERGDEKKNGGWYILSLIFFTAALLSKTSTIMLPGILVLCRFWFRASWKFADFLRLLPFFLLSFATGIVRIWYESGALGARGALHPETFVERLLIAGHVPYFYLKKLFFPYPLIFHYPKWEIEISQGSMYFPVIGLGLSAGLLFWKLRGWGRGFFTGMAVFGITLFPVLGFFNIAWYQFSYVTDHWAYIPSLPLTILAVQGGIQLFEKSAEHKLLLYQMGIVFVSGSIYGLFAILTLQQTLNYKDEKTHSAAIIANNPKAWFAHFRLGDHFLENEQFELALKHYDETLKYSPPHAEAYNSRALVYIQLKQYDQAMKSFNQALKIHPRYVEAYDSRGYLYFQLGEYEKAMQDYERALKLNPKFVKTHNKRGLFFFQMKRYEQAIQAYSEAIAIDPEFIKAYINRGNTYFQIDQFGLAIRDYEEALKIDPSYAKAFHNRGSVFLYMNQYDRAIESYDEAIRIDPDSINSYLNRGIAYLKLNRLDQSLKDLNHVIQNRPDLALAYHHRGNVYIKKFKNTGRACRDWEKACQLGNCGGYSQSKKNKSC